MRKPRDIPKQARYSDPRMLSVAFGTIYIDDNRRHAGSTLAYARQLLSRTLSIHYLALVFLVLLLPYGCGSSQNKELATYFGEVIPVIQEHYDAFIVVYESAGSPSLSEELVRQSNLRSETAIKGEMTRIAELSAKLVGSLNVAYTKLQNVPTPSNAKEFHDLVLQMMQLRLDGWRIRYQESTRFIRVGTMDPLRLRQVNEDFLKADRLWVEAKAEAIELGRNEINEIKVP